MISSFGMKVLQGTDWGSRPGLLCFVAYRCLRKLLAEWCFEGLLCLLCSHPAVSWVLSRLPFSWNPLWMVDLEAAHCASESDTSSPFSFSLHIVFQAFWEALLHFYEEIPTANLEIFFETRNTRCSVQEVRRQLHIIYNATFVHREPPPTHTQHTHCWK